MKNLFDNVGLKIQKVAKTIFYIEAIIACIAGGVGAIISLFSGNFIGFIASPISAFLLVAIFYLSVLMIICIGKITENAEKQIKIADAKCKLVTDNNQNNILKEVNPVVKNTSNSEGTEIEKKIVNVDLDTMFFHKS